VKVDKVMACPLRSFTIHYRYVSVTTNRKIRGSDLQDKMFNPAARASTDQYGVCMYYDLGAGLPDFFLGTWENIPECHGIYPKHIKYTKRSNLPNGHM
jgi:hypothetical protein